MTEPPALHRDHDGNRLVRFREKVPREDAVPAVARAEQASGSRCSEVRSFSPRGCSYIASPNFRVLRESGASSLVAPRSARAPSSGGENESCVSTGHAGRLACDRQARGRASWCSRMPGDIRGWFAGEQTLWCARPLVGIGVGPGVCRPGGLVSLSRSLFSMPRAAQDGAALLGRAFGALRYRRSSIRRPYVPGPCALLWLGSGSRGLVAMRQRRRRARRPRPG